MAAKDAEIGGLGGPVNSVAKALRVLNCFTPSQGYLTLAQISKELEMPKSTVLNLIRTLEHWGYLMRVSGQSYQLGYKVLELGYSMQTNLPVIQYALPFMEKLQIQTGEIIYLTSHIDGRVLYLEGLYPSIRVGNYSNAGKTLPMHCTGCGKAMLAYLPQEELSWVLDTQPLVRFTPSTITHRGALLEELETIRRRGYAIDVEEESPGVKCVGMPIRDSDGYPVGALSISGTVMSMRDELLDNYARAISRACQGMIGNAGQFPAAQMRQKRVRL